MPVAVTRTPSGLRLRRRLQRPGQSAVGEQRRVDPVREIPQLGDGDLEVVGQLIEHLRRRVRLVGQHVLWPAAG